MVLVVFLFLTNILTFILYGQDKHKARTGRWRISERFLILFPVIFCGCLGALLGMLIWRHKIRKPKFYITIPIFLVLHMTLWGYCLYQDYHLVTTEYDIDLGLRQDLTIVQISDLHNQVFGINEHILLDRIRECDPDIIVVTGDVVDSMHTSFPTALTFMTRAGEIAPVYYITGNHEWRFDQERLDTFISSLTSNGVTFLDDTYVETNGVILAGISDRSLRSFEENGAYGPFPDGSAVILLAHEPQYTSLYSYLNADLVLAGHIHGGQIIIPGRGGLLSPEVEFFPEYYSGIFDLGGTQMIVSRGLGNSAVPIRINNYPEIVLVHIS